MKQVLLFLILSLFNLAAPAQCNFRTIGHRGGSSYYYPENTLISLEHGFMEEIFAAEVDVQPTADSVLVLMHDFYVDRTTDGYGEVEHLPLSYLKTLDAGSWKNPGFMSAQVPTLAEALQLAEKYGKKLYLNMKVFVPQLIERTLREAGVAQDRILIDPDDLDKVSVYHAMMPESPLVYFGSLPTPVDDPDFYLFLKDHGVIAIEIPADYIRYASDDTYEKVRDLAHSYGLELWAYTANDPPYLKLLKDFGIDGLETDRPSEVNQVFCADAYGGFFPEKRITGQWDFNNNLNGTVGSKLVFIGDTSISNQKIQFGTTGSFGLPPIENSQVEIALIPALDPAHALRFFSNIAPEGLPGGLACDNTYSLVFDLLKPAGKEGYTAIFQTSNNNSDDADLFLSGNQNSIGVLEQYRGEFADSTWVRIAVVVDLYENEMGIYFNGNPAGTVTLDNGRDGRFCINNNWGIQSSNFFSDNDGETNPVFVSSIQLRNYAMSEEEIEALGSPEAAKISRSIVPDENPDCPEFEKDIELAREGNAINLVAQAGDRVNYLWEMNKGSGWESIAGTAFKNPASPVLSIVSSPELLNGYLFRCTAFNDCRTFSNELVFNDLSLVPQIPEFQGRMFDIYPNPSGGTVNINVQQSKQKYDLTVYTLEGTEVYRQRSVSGIAEIRLASGTFLVHIRSGKMSEVQKLLIMD